VNGNTIAQSIIEQVSEGSDDLESDNWFSHKVTSLRRLASESISQPRCLNLCTSPPDIPST